MKRCVLVLLIVCGLASGMSAQISDTHIDRRIYLWDVTMSMQGYDSKAPKNYNADIDVWDKVVAFLRRDIENISDASTELIVLPFQEKILDRWIFRATAEGKAELIRRIDESARRFQNITNTNIAQPFKEVKEMYIKPRQNNLLILLTDGQHSEKFGGKKVWLEMLSEWQTYAHDNNAYLIYFMVTEAAEDKDIAGIVENKGCSDLVMDTGNIPEFIELYPVEAVNLNIKDDIEKGVYIKFENPKKAIQLASGIQLSVKTQPDAEISVDTTVEIENGKCLLRLPYTYENLKSKLLNQEKMEVPMNIELLNQEEIQNKYGQKIFLKRKSVKLVLINKIERVLTIRIKR